MIKRSVLFSVISLIPAATSLAQTRIVLPAEYERGWGRGSTSALGSNASRTQMIFAYPFAIGTPVLGIGMRPSTTAVNRASFTADIEIKMSSTAMAPGALSATFANNEGSDMVVALPRQIVTIPAMPANASTGAFAEFMFPTPFLFGLNSNSNICVEVLVYSRSAGASWSTDRAFAAVNGRVANAGLGCGTATISSTTTGGTYSAGATIAVTLAAAPVSSLAFLLPSFDCKEFAPGLLLPMPLSTFGAAAGCDLLVNPALGAVVFVTDAFGGASSTVVVPAGYGRFGLGWQWLYQVPQTTSNPLGIATTANRAMWIGPEIVVPGAQYVWDLTSATIATGNATTDSVPIVEFIKP